MHLKTQKTILLNNRLKWKKSQIKIHILLQTKCECCFLKKSIKYKYKKYPVLTKLLQASQAASLWVTGYGWPCWSRDIQQHYGPWWPSSISFWNIALVLIGWFPWFHWKNVRRSILDLICTGHWSLCWAPAECVIYHSFAFWITKQKQTRQYLLFKLICLLYVEW